MKRIISLLLALTMLTGVVSAFGISAYAYTLSEYTEYGEWIDGIVSCPKGSKNTDSDADCDYYTFKVPADGKLTIDVSSTSEVKKKYEVWVSFFKVVKSGDKKKTQRIKDYYTETDKSNANLTKTVNVEKGEYAICIASCYYDVEQTYYLKLDFKPSKPTLSLTETKKKKVKAKWSRVNGVSGYVLEYADNKKFRDKTTVEISGQDKLSKITPRLEEGKKYFFRVRCVVSVGKGENKKTFESAWSKRQSITIE